MLENINHGSPQKKSHSIITLSKARRYNKTLNINEFSLARPYKGVYALFSIKCLAQIEHVFYSLYYMYWMVEEHY